MPHSQERERRAVLLTAVGRIACNLWLPTDLAFSRQNGENQFHLKENQEQAHSPSQPRKKAGRPFHIRLVARHVFAQHFLVLPRAANKDHN